MGPESSGLDLALEQARRGESVGFDALFRAHGGAVARYLRARGVSDPDGIANEVFVRAFRNIHTVRGDAARFRSWLFGIAHNAAIDDVRRRRRRPVETQLGHHADVAAGDVEAEAISAVERELVQSLLERLPVDQRDVILLRVLGDLSVSQTAGVLGKSYEAVKALQRRAVTNMSRMLDPAASAPSSTPRAYDGRHV